MDKFQQADYDWLQCMERIGRKELAYFENDCEGYSEQIVALNCRRSIMVWVYNVLKSARKITPIEQLSKDAKSQVWSFVLEICKGREYDKKRMLDIAKVFYLIEYFLNENKL